MNTVILILQFLPQVINIIKKIKAMSDDGLSKQEIENALNKIELAFNDIQNDDDLADSLNDQWVSSVEEGSVPPKIPENKGTES